MVLLLLLKFKSYSCFRSFDTNSYYYFKDIKSVGCFLEFHLPNFSFFEVIFTFRMFADRWRWSSLLGASWWLNPIKGNSRVNSRRDRKSWPRFQTLPNTDDVRIYFFLGDIFLFSFLKRNAFANREYVSFSFVKLQKTLVFRSFCNFQYY